jgi:pimeloyl-ACP methyl ester carboxylesterase
MPFAGDIYYRDIGSGTPLLILHGGWGYEFYPFEPLPGFRYLIPDRVGYGRSPRLAEFARPFHALAAQEHASFLDALGIARCAVWGHSDGAVIAAHMAIAAPDRFTHVILEALHVDREKPRSRAFFTMMAEAPDAFGPRVTEKLAAEHGDTWRMPIQADGRVWLELATTPGTLFDVQALRSPTLVITGSDDPRREPGELAAFGDRVVEIPGGGHAPHSERVVAERTASVASHFLRR